MKVLKGTSASSGIVEGTVCCYSAQQESEIAHYTISAEQIPKEVARTEEAFKKTEKKMAQMIAVSGRLFDNKSAQIFNAHLMILKDKLIRDKILRLISEKKINGEHAVMDAFEEYSEKLGNSGMHFEEITHDMTDVRNRLLEAFGNSGGRFLCPLGDRQSVIVASKRFNPSMILEIPRQNVLAFVTQEGGYTTHATILARSYGVPVIFGIDVERHLKCRDRIIVDASSGKVIVSPDRKTRQYYKKKMDRIKERAHTCSLESSTPARLKQGGRITLKLNINSPLEMELTGAMQHDGIGLLRTEFLFMKRDRPPSEEEQVDMYRGLLEKAAGKPVTARMMDIDAEKIPPYMQLPRQVNPDLGIRGARAVEFFQDIYLVQARAFLRAAVYGDLRILYPMISDPSDIETYKSLFSKAAAALKKDNEKFKSDVSFGAMIETPSAALMAEQIMQMVDFANIGSNDLLQYALAAERGNTFVEKRYHILHPSLVRLMEIAAKAGRRFKKEVCLCGEISSFEEFYPVLLDIGLTSFSVPVHSFNDIKCALLGIDLKGKGKILDKFYAISSGKKLNAFFASHYD